MRPRGDCPAVRAHPFLLVPFLLLALTVPTASAEEECVNVAVDRLASGPDAWVVLFGAVGAGASVGPVPVLFPDGLAVAAYVLPEECQVSPPCRDLPEKVRGLCHVVIHPPGLP